MTGVEELQEIECLTAANFTEDDPVWTMAEGCFQEVTDADSRQTVLWLPSFKTNEVVLVHLNFGGVIAYGQHSEKNKVTQYTVQRGDGTRFFETEENLRALPSPPKPNSGPLTGTWEGVMYGLPQGDLSFTAIFEQEGEKIVGVLAFFFGGAAFKPSAFRNKELELHMDTPLANFVLKAEYKANEISGRWSTDERSNGTWECKKVIEGASVH